MSFTISKLDKSFVYKKFTNKLIEKYGKDIADAIWVDANTELVCLLNKYSDADTDEK